MKKYTHTTLYFLLAILVLGLQSCLGIGDNNNQFQTKFTTKNGSQVGINGSDQSAFKGKIYFTIDRNLYVLDGQKKLTQLTHDMDVRDPAVSPDHQWIAFIVRKKYSSDLNYMSTNPADKTIHTVASGQGQYGYFISNDGQITPGTATQVGPNTSYWFSQPSWSADSSHLLFLSDLQKYHTWDGLPDAPLLDLQVFSLPIGAPALDAKGAIAQATPIAYANFGDGGDRDASYRPNHPNQVIYTHYSYDANQTQQVVQILLEDATLMALPNDYHPGIIAGSQLDPSVALTPDTPNTMNLQPTFSPDGNTLLYLRRDDATHMSMYTMPVADPNDPNQTTNNQTHPGLKQALTPYTTQSSKLLTQQYISQPTWSPDGQRIAYIGYANHNFDISLAKLNRDPKTGAYSIQPDSTVQLTDAQGHLDADSSLCWTP